MSAVAGVRGGCRARPARRPSGRWRLCGAWLSAAGRPGGWLAVGGAPAQGQRAGGGSAASRAKPVASAWAQELCAFEQVIGPRHRQVGRTAPRSGLPAQCRLHRLLPGRAVRDRHEDESARGPGDAVGSELGQHRPRFPRRPDVSMMRQRQRALTAASSAGPASRTSRVRATLPPADRRLGSPMRPVRWPVQPRRLRRSSNVASSSWTLSSGRARRVCARAG